MGNTNTIADSERKTIEKLVYKADGLEEYMESMNCAYCVRATPQYGCTDWKYALNSRRCERVAERWIRVIRDMHEARNKKTHPQLTEEQMNELELTYGS